MTLSNPACYIELAIGVGLIALPFIHLRDPEPGDGGIAIGIIVMGLVLTIAGVLCLLAPA